MDTFGQSALNPPHSWETARGRRQADPNTKLAIEDLRKKPACTRLCSPRGWPTCSSTHHKAHTAASSDQLMPPPSASIGSAPPILHPTSSLPLANPCGAGRSSPYSPGSIFLDPHIRPPSDRTATPTSETTWGTHHADYAGPHPLDLDTRSAYSPTPIDQDPPGSEHQGNHCRRKTTPPVGPKFHSRRRAVSHPQQLAGTLPAAWTVTPAI